MHIIDGNALLYTLQKQPRTFTELASIMFECLPRVKCGRIDFVTDSYQPISIKYQERITYSSGKEFIISGPLTRVPTNRKNFLRSSKSKIQVNDLLLKEWSNMNMQINSMEFNCTSQTKTNVSFCLVHMGKEL